MKRQAAPCARSDGGPITGTTGILLAGIIAVSLPCVATAQERVADNGGPLLITLGSYAVWGPRFEGAKRHDWSPWPIIGWRRASEKQWLDLPTDGLDYALIETENFRAGPVGYLRWARDNGTIAPRGFTRVDLGGGRRHASIDLSLEAGGFLEYWPAEWLRTRLEVREAFLGANGLLGILSADLVWKPQADLTFSMGPRLTVADRRFMESYYGVDGVQAVSSGLPVYSPGSGLRSFGAGAFVRYKLTPEWTTQAFVDYQHLTGVAGDSPVITTRGTPEQVMIGVGLSYTFKAPW